MKHSLCIGYLLVFFFTSSFCMRQSGEGDTQPIQFSGRTTGDVSISMTPASSSSPQKHQGMTKSSGTKGSGFPLGLSPKKKAPSPFLTSSGNVPKQTPASLEEVSELARIRSSRLRQRRNQKSVFVGSGQGKKPDSVPSFPSGQLQDIQAQQAKQQQSSQKMFTRDQVDEIIAQSRVKARQSIKLYTEEEVAEILKTASFDQPALSSRFHKLGKEYNVPLKDLPVYADLLDEVHISPRIMAEFMNKHSAGSQPNDYEVKGYQKISENDPDRYEKLVFALFKELMHQAETGDDDTKKQAVSPVFFDTHVEVLKDTIGDREEKLWNRAIAIVTLVTGWILTGVGWAIEASHSSHGSSPVNGTVV